MVEVVLEVVLEVCNMGIVTNTCKNWYLSSSSINSSIVLILLLLLLEYICSCSSCRRIFAYTNCDKWFSHLTPPISSQKTENPTASFTTDLCETFKVTQPVGE